MSCTYDEEMSSVMAVDLRETYRAMVVRGKYQGLYAHLTGLQSREWRTSFSEIEEILGFGLPPSARLHRPWWGNQNGGSGHSHALAWSVAGWETAEVNMEAETLVFRRTAPELPPRPPLDDVWPVNRTSVWPKDLSLRREDLYDDRL